MTEKRIKLHPSSCFPPIRAQPDIRNRLFIRIAPNEIRNQCFRLTFIGANTTTYSTIAALLAHTQPSSIDNIKIFDISEKYEICAMLNDLQVITVYTKSNIHLERIQTYWETKDSNIIIIDVQHHQLENESTSKWIQLNTRLMETVVAQVCKYSPHATLIICTQPNELMTYVASRVSRFPTGRVLGLGASVATAYAHKTILNRTGNIHGHVNGFFIIGNGLIDHSCRKSIVHNLTIDGISCSDIRTKFNKESVQDSNSSCRTVSREKSRKHWDILERLKNNEILYSNIRRQSPTMTDLVQWQSTLTKYLLSSVTNAHLNSTSQESFDMLPLSRKQRSNWTEAMIMIKLIRALVNGAEFQSNLVVNMASLTSSNNVFINYPTIVGSSDCSIEYMLPYECAQYILNQRLFLIPYEKLQTTICLR